MVSVKRLLCNQDSLHSFIRHSNLKHSRLSSKSEGRTGGIYGCVARTSRGLIRSLCWAAAPFTSVVPLFEHRRALAEQKTHVLGLKTLLSADVPATRRCRSRPQESNLIRGNPLIPKALYVAGSIHGTDHSMKGIAI